MNCTDIRPLLSYYIDDEATPEERAQVEQHLAHCQACKRQMAEYSVMGAEIRSMPLPVPPASLRRDVWRAIEAKQSSPGIFGGTPVRTRQAAPPRSQAQRGPSLVTIFTNMGNSWARAIPAALLVIALLVGTLFMMRNISTQPNAAELMEAGEITAYSQPVRVQFNTQVIPGDAEAYTYVYRLVGQERYPVTVTSDYNSISRVTGILTLKPQSAWEPGTTYEIVIDCPKIRRGVENEKMGNSQIPLRFTAAAHTPTPTSTPTNTPTPTETPVPPTRIPETAVADNSPTRPAGGPANTPVPTTVADMTPGVKPSATRPPNPTNTRPAPTSTHAPLPTSTSAPTSTVAPSRTPVIIATPTTRVVPTATTVPPTSTPAITPTATQVKSTPSPTATTQPKVTATATPGQNVTPSPTPQCSTLPVRGFGKVWKANPQVRIKVGCPTSGEIDIPQAAQQRFEGGMMFWRADTRTVYVFIGGQRDDFGVWHQFADTWLDTDPTPQPQKSVPPGQFEPVRGFGKVWRNNPAIREALGWAIEQEWNITAAWQTYERGFALWTSDRVIRFMYSDGIYARFDDTFTELSSQE